MYVRVKEKRINYLAHLYLSGKHKDVLIGNFMGDFIKGNQWETLPEMVGKGVLLHREIDHFTDSHSIVLQSKDKLRVQFRHFSGIIVDMFYDYFLAKNFAAYHTQPLPDFAQQCYRLLLKNQDVLPEKARHMLHFMVKGNWLCSYATKEGIHRSLKGIGRRTSYTSELHLAIQILTENEASFEEEFKLFFTDMREHANAFLRNELKLD